MSVDYINEPTQRTKEKGVKVQNTIHDLIGARMNPADKRFLINTVTELYGADGLASSIYLLSFLENQNEVYMFKIKKRVGLNKFQFVNLIKKINKIEEHKVIFGEQCIALIDQTSSLYYLITYDEFSFEEGKGGVYEVSIYGYDYKETSKKYEKLKKKLSKMSITTLHWALRHDGRVIYKDLELDEVNPVYDEYYPWIEEGVDKLYENYMNSSEPILFLIGEPGTGKTTFIKNFIKKYDLGTVITYDEMLIREDSFFLEFLEEEETPLMVIEDADTFLYKRKSDEPNILAKFLNVSDGLIKNSKKKIIFSTNIVDETKIDEAIIRPGRCYGVYNFRKLTRNEAEAAIKAGNIDTVLSEKKDEFSLADLWAVGKKERQSFKMGF